MKLTATIFLLMLGCHVLTAQTLGGSTVYSFLNQPATPQLSALGGINNSNISTDAGLSFTNPALLRPSLAGQLAASFNSIYGGINNYFCQMPFYSAKLETSFAGGVDFFDYGHITQTDASGNIMGDLRPVDYALQLSAARQYEQHWYYGASLKFIHSAYGIYRSSGIAMDIGINYYDSARLFQVGLTARNMGLQLRSYQGTGAGDLPLDISLGVTKRLAKAPIQFSFTAHHLQQFNLRYNDTAFNDANGFDQNDKGSKFTVDKLFRHFILAVQVVPEDRVEITMAYNYLRRKELNIGPAGNGFTGFSFGLGVLLKKWQLRYAKSFYQNNTGYNQFGLNIRLND